MIEVDMYSLSFCFFIFLRKIELQTPSSFDPPNNQISTLADSKVQNQVMWQQKAMFSIKRFSQLILLNLYRRVTF